MNEYIPAFSKAKVAIDDHLDWARVHLSELEKVQDDISNKEFFERCNDIFRELVELPLHFTLLCRKPRVRLIKPPNDSILKFEQLKTKHICDLELRKWVQDRLQNVEKIAKTTFNLINTRDGVELRSELRNKFPSEWFTQNPLIKNSLFIPGRSLEVGAQSRFSDQFGISRG